MRPRHGHARRIVEPLGTVCADQAPETIAYTRTFGPLACGEHYVTNIASFETVYTKTVGSDSATVHIKVECPDGCTRTQGYWKNHSAKGPAPADPVWELLPQGPDTTFFKSGESWYEVFWTEPDGNAYYILALQYMAAVLNGLADADTFEVDDLLAEVTSFFETYGPSEWQAVVTKQVLVDWATILEQFNSGKLGAMHCQ